MGKQRVITPDQMGSEPTPEITPASSSFWDDFESFDPTPYVEQLRGVDYKYGTPEFQTEEMPNMADSAMQSIGLAYQSGVRSWLNHLGNYMDQLHISELEGKKQMVLKQLDEYGIVDAESSLELVELERQKKEYELEIAQRPVNKEWLEDLASINMQGSADFLSGNHLKQLSEDLAGTLMYMGPQLLAAAGTIAATALTGPLGGGPAAAMWVSLGATAANAAVIGYTRHMESLAEVGDAYEQRMMQWEAEYLKNNPDVSQEKYHQDKLAAQVQARQGIDDLYDRNMTLIIPDIISTSLMLGSFGPAARLFKSASPIVAGAKHAALNPLWQYYSEGIWEEGSQYNWQKDYSAGKYDKSTNTFFDNAVQAYTRDAADVLSAALPGFLPADEKLATDPDFHTAIGRGGKSAAIMGLIPGLFNAAHTAYNYSQVKNSVAKHIPQLKQQYNAQKRGFMFDILESSRQGMFRAAVNSHVKSGALTEQEGKEAIKELEELEKEYSKVDDLIFSRASSLKNRLDKSTRKEAFVLAGAIRDLRRQKEQELSELSANDNATNIFEDDIVDTDNFESLRKEREEFWDKRIAQAEKELKKVVRGDVRASMAAYDKAVAAANALTDTVEKGKALARAELDHNLTLQRRRKNIYGDEARNRVHFNNLKIFKDFLAKPTLETAESLLQAAAQTSTPVLSNLREYIASTLELELGDRAKLEKEMYTAEQIAAHEDTDEAWANFDAAVNRLSEHVTKEAAISRIRQKDEERYNVSVDEKKGTTTVERKDGNPTTPADVYNAVQEFILGKSADSTTPQEFQDNMILWDMLRGAISTANDALTNPLYSNVAALEEATGKLDQFIDYLKGDTQRTSPKAPIVNLLEDMKKGLEERKEQVEKNSNSNKVKSEKEFKRISGLGQKLGKDDKILHGMLAASSVKAVRDIAAQDEISTADLITALHLMTADERESMARYLQMDFANILDELPNGIGGRLRSQILTGLDDEMTFNLSYDPLEYSRFSDVLNDESLYLVMRYGVDFRSIMEEIKAGNGTSDLSMEDLETVVAELEKLRDLEFLIAHTAYEAIQDPAGAFEAMADISNRVTYPPNGEQTYLMMYMLGVLQKGNSVGLTGYAGAGKTVTIGNLITLLETQGIDQDDIVVTAKLDRIRESMGAKTGLDAVEFDKLNESVEGKKFLIIDEAGYLTREDIEAIEQLRSKNKDLTILYVGDPNQLNEAGGITSPMTRAINDGVILGTPALTIVNRTPILPLRDFQSRFIGYDYNDSPVVGKHNQAGDTGLVVTDMEGALSKFEILKGSKVFITDKATKESLKERLGENVVEAHEVQGMEFDHVFIALPTPTQKVGIEARVYNTRMYVASTRATKSIHFVTNQAIQNTVVDKVPTAEMSDLDEARKQYEKSMEDIRGEKKTSKDDQEEDEESAEEEVKERTEEEEDPTNEGDPTTWSESEIERRRQEDLKEYDENRPQGIYFFDKDEHPLEKIADYFRKVLGWNQVRFVYDPERKFYIYQQDANGVRLGETSVFAEGIVLGNAKGTMTLSIPDAINARYDLLRKLLKEREAKKTDEKKREAPDPKYSGSGDTKVPIGIPTINSEGEVETVITEDIADDESTATTDGPDSFETGSDGSVIGGLPSVKARRRGVPEKTRKKWWKVPFPVSKAIKTAINTEKLAKAFEKGPIQATVTMRKVMKGAKMYVDVSVVWDGAEIGQFPIPVTKTAEAQAQIDATTDPNHKALLQAALDAYVADPNFSGVMEIGELTVEDITYFSSWMSGSPMTLTKNAVAALKKKIEKTVYADDNPVRTNHHVVINAGGKTGNIDALADSLYGEEREAVLRLKDNNALLQSATKRGHPFLILTTEKENGQWQAIAIPIQPRKLRQTDKIVQVIRDFADQADKLMSLTQQHMPEALRTSIYGTLSELVKMYQSDAMTDEQKQIFAPYLFKEQGFLLAFQKMQPYLKMLYKSNRQLRNAEGTGLNLTIEELIELAYSFDEEGNSNFSKKGATTKKGYRYNGVYLPVQFASNRALKYNIDLDEASAKGVDVDRRKEMGHMFTIMEMNFDSTSVQASNFKRTKPAATTKTDQTLDETDGDIGFGFDGLMGGIDMGDTNFRTEGYGDETLIDRAEAEAIVRRLLPKATLDQIRFVTSDVIRRMTKARSQWGFETARAIAVARTQDGKIFKEVLRHELFHRVFRTMDETTRQAMMRAYKLEHPEDSSLTDKQIEERLAIEFERFERKPATFASRLKAFFLRIANLIGFYRTNFKTIDQAFNEIESGVFKKLGLPSASSTTMNYFHEILDAFPDVQSIINVKEDISKILANYLITNIRASVAESSTFDPLMPLTAILNKYRARGLALLEKAEADLTDQDLRNLAVYRALGVIPSEEGHAPNFKGFQYLAQQVTGVKGLRFTNSANSQLTTTRVEETELEEKINQMLDEAEMSEEEKEVLRQDGWMIDSDNVDVTLTLTESVKLFTKLIPRYKGDKIVGVENSGKIYKVLSDMFQNFVVPDGQSFTRALLDFLDDRLRETNDKSTQAALAMIRALHLKAGTPIRFEQGRYVLRGRFEFLSDPSDTENTGLLGSYMGATGDKKVTVVEQKNMSAAHFFSKIAAEMKEAGYSKEQVMQAQHDFKVAEIQDLRNSIITHLGSPYKKNLMTAYVNKGRVTEKRKKFAYEAAFVDNHRGRIVKQLQDPLEQVFPLEAFNDLDNRIKMIDDFLFEDYKRLRGDSKGFLKDATEVFAKVWHGTAFENSVPHFNGAKDASNKMRMIKNYMQSVKAGQQPVNVSSVADTLYYFSAENVPSSVQDGSKNLYIYSPGSSATLAFRTEISKKNSDGAKRSPFFKFNPIATGNNMIRRMVQHLKIVELSQREAAKENTYSGETSFDYWHRQINFSFMQPFSKKGQTAFISWVYTISDKPKAVGVEVAPVKEEDKVNWIRQALDQEADLVNRDVKSAKLLQRKANLQSNKKAEKFTFIDTETTVQEYMAMTETKKKNFAKKLLKQLEAEGQTLAEDLRKQGFMIGEEAAMQEAVKNYQEIIGASKAVKPEDSINYMVQEAYVQNYLIRHFTNQMIVGDMNVYKNDVDLIKRMAGPFAPGTQPIGINPTFSSHTIADDAVVLNELFDPEGKFKELHGTEFEATDAQQFRSYKRTVELMRAMGSTADIGFIDKPVVDFVDPNTGEKFYHKMAVLTLTPSLSNKFYKARRMSELMQKNKVDELNYKSASKAANLPSMAQSFFDIYPEGNLQVPSTAYRQQLPTTSKIGKSDAVVMPSQLVYHLLNSAEKNVEAAHIIYSEIAEIINSKRKLWEGKTDSEEKIVALVKSITKDDPQNSFIYELLEQSGVAGLAVAGVTTKVNQLLLSKFYKEIQEIKFKGMKLQIVADTFADVFEIDGEIKTLDRLTPEQRSEVIEGYYNVIEAQPHLEPYIKAMKKHEALGKLDEFYAKMEEENKKRVEEQKVPISIETLKSFEGKLIPRNLEYFKEDPKTGRAYAEVIMPNAYKKYLDNDGILSHEAMKALGFRLPSTDLHSAIALKAVAFYDENGQATPIIAPKEIVVLHGSDNDADSLNVIQKEVFKGRTPLKITDKLTYERGDIIGEKLGYEAEIAELEKAVEESPTKQMRDLLRYARQNRIVDTFLDVITDPKNRAEMITPISFDPLMDEDNRSNDENLALLKEDMAALKENRTAFINDPNITLFRKMNALAGKIVRGPLGSPNSLIADNKYRAINLAGKDLVGVYANGGKAVYLNMDENGKFVPSGLANPLPFFGLEVEGFVQTEIYPTGEKGVPVSILQDIFVNFATDNAKVQALEPMNQTMTTAPMTALLNRLGVPIIYQTLLFNSPVIRLVTQAYEAMGDVTKRNIVVNGMMIDLRSKSSIVSSISKALKVPEGKPLPPTITLEQAIDLYTTNIEDLTREQILQAGVLLEMFSKIEALTTSFKNITSATSALNSSIKDRSTAYNILEAVDEIAGREEGEDFPNSIKDVPHLKANQLYIRFVLNVLTNNFLFNDRGLFDSMRSLQAYFGIKKSDELGQRRLESALEQFLMSRLPLIQTLKAGTKPIVKDKQQLGSLESFKQNFVQKMLKLKRERESIEHEGAKMFLSKLSDASKFAPGMKADLRRLTFDGKSLREDADIYIVREGVRYLIKKYPGLADELAAYTILEYGLQFQTNGLTKVMPVEIFESSIQWLSEVGPAEVEKYNDASTMYEAVFAAQYIRANYVKTNINSKTKALPKSPGMTFAVQSSGGSALAPVSVSQGFENQDIEDEQGRPVVTGRKFAIRTHVKEDLAIYQSIPYINVSEYDSSIAENFDPHKDFNLTFTNLFATVDDNGKIEVGVLEEKVKELTLPEGSIVRVLRAGKWPSLDHLYELQKNGTLKEVKAESLDWDILKKKSEEYLDYVFQTKSELAKEARENAKAYREQKEKERKEAEELRNKCNGS